MGIKFRADQPPTTTLSKPAPKPTAGDRLIKAATQAREMAKRGPKPSGKAKTLVSIRLDQDVIDGFKSGGDGWQSRMNETLRKALKI